MQALRSIALTVAAVAALALGACQSQAPVVSLRERADHNLRLHRYAEAADGYQKIVDRYPGDWDAQYKLGMCLMELGQVTAARRALEIAHDERPSDVRVADALAEAMYRQKDEATLFAFLRNQAERTQSVHSYLQLARYSMELDDPDSARVAVQTAIEIDEGRSVEPYLLAADLAERVGDFDLVERRLRQAHGINPHDERVRVRLREIGQTPGPTLAMPAGR